MNKEKSNPGQAAADDMKYIVDMAQNAPFAMQALTDSFVKFRSAGLDPTDGSLKRWWTPLLVLVVIVSC